MSRFSRLVPLFAMPVLFAACSGSGDNPLSPPAPRHNGLLVGGNATPPPDSTQTGTTSTTSTSSGEVGGDPAVKPDSTGRGLLVGGN